MSAASELYGASDAISLLCQRCCDVMYYFSDLFGVTYGELNMYCFYILQPVIYGVLLWWELIYLYRKTKHKIGRKVLLTLSFVPVGYLLAVMAKFAGKNLDALCYVKIDNLYRAAHAVHLTYAEINILIFILGFLFICFLHFLFYVCRKKKVAYAITLFFLLVSPLFVFVFNI